MNYTLQKIIYDKQRNCIRCGKFFKHSYSLGNHDCLYHPYQIIIGDKFNYFMCCLKMEGSIGCTPCDHTDLCEPEEHIPSEMIIYLCNMQQLKFNSKEEETKKELIRSGKEVYNKKGDLDIYNSYIFIKTKLK